MKKISVFLCSLALFLTLTGLAGAITFTDSETLNVWMGEGPFAQGVLVDSYTYSHETPLDFAVPPDTANSATITINGYFVDSDQNQVSVSGTGVGTLMTGGSFGYYWNWGWHWYDYPSITTFDVITSFQSSWTAGAPLSVSINTDGNFGDGAIYLASSLFTLNYTNGTSSDPAAPAPVPEPSTMLLLGIGLLGLVVIGRRKFNPNE
jgi:hypothetical protein